MSNRLPTLNTYEDAKHHLDQYDPIDDYGFHKKPFGRGEPVEEEIKRLELNLAFYREFIRNLSKFPDDVHEQRKFDFDRLRNLKKREEDLA